MGLCKCPKRRVTNQFCFEHHVNVCENCMVTNHARCVVQSYLQWLQDSDYSAGCQLCSSDIAPDDSIRLTCYHVFHWSCIQSMASSLPPNVAPAGYHCPQCQVGLFPQPNLISPVADILRGKLATVNWGRAGLGLPLLAEKRDPPDGCKVTVDFDVDSKPISLQNSSMMRNQNKPIVHSVESGAEHNYNNFYGASQSRRSVSRPSPIGRHLDSDDDKYKRRSPREVISRFITRAACISPKMMKKQRWITALVLVVLFIFIILLMKEMSHRVTDDDPSFNLENEPNIKVGDV